LVTIIYEKSFIMHYTWKALSKVLTKKVLHFKCIKNILNPTYKHVNNDTDENEIFNRSPSHVYTSQWEN